MDNEPRANDESRPVQLQLEEALRTADRLGETLLAARICEALDAARAAAARR